MYNRPPQDINFACLQHFVKKLIDQLDKRGELPAGTNPDKLFKEVMQDIREDFSFALTLSQGPQKAAIKALTAMIILESVNQLNTKHNLPRLELDYKELFIKRDLNDQQKFALQQQLKKFLQMHMERIAELKLNRPLNSEEKTKIADKANQLAMDAVSVKEPMVNENINGALLATAKMQAELTAKEIADRTLNAGADIHSAGGIVFTVLAIQEGLRAGYTNQTQGIGEGLLESTNRYDTNKADPLGLENFARVCEIATDSICEALVPELIDDNILQSPRPRPKF